MADIREVTASVDMTTFVTVALTLFAAVVASYLLIQSKVSSIGNALTGLSERVARAEERNDSQTTEILSIKEDQQAQMRLISEIEGRRADDVLRFTEALGKLNATLVGINTTMQHNSQVMIEVKNAINEQQKEIARIKVA